MTLTAAATATTTAATTTTTIINHSNHNNNNNANQNNIEMNNTITMTRCSNDKIQLRYETRMLYNACFLNK